MVGKELVCGGIKRGRGLEDTATGLEYRERKSLNTESGSLGSCWKLEKARTLELLEGGNLADTGSRPITPFRTLSSRMWCSAELGSASKLLQQQEIFRIQAEVRPRVKDSGSAGLSTLEGVENDGFLGRWEWNQQERAC